MVNLMAKVKTTLVIDEEVWREFSALVVARHGGDRKLSASVEEALRSFNPLLPLRRLIKDLQLRVDSYPSSREILASRVKVDLSAGRTIRELRDERQESVSGFKLHRKAVR